MSTTTVETPASDAATTVETTEEPFDKERAMATIKTLREYEKEAKRLQGELDKRTKAESDAEAQRLKDDAKWEQLATAETAKREAAEAALEAERLKLRDRLAQAEVRTIATRLRFHKPEIAFRLIDTDKLEYDDDGMPTNAEAMLAELAKTDDYLVAKEDGARRGTPEATRGDTAGLSREERIAQEIASQRRRGR